MTEEHARKRKRIALSCDNCRKKKTKCDRKLPCGYCIKLSIPHTCVYSSPNHVNNSNSARGDLAIQQELLDLKLKIRELENAVARPSPETPNERLKHIPTYSLSNEAIYIESEYSVMENNQDLMLGINPIGSEDEIISFYFDEGEGKEKVPALTLPFFSLLKRDPGVHLFWSYFTRPEVGINFRDVFFNRIGNDNKKWGYIHEKALEILGDNYIKRISDGFSIDIVKQSLSNWGRDYGVIFHPVDISQMTMADKLISIFNTMAPIQSYVSVFFKKLYPYFPIIDEKLFRQEVARVLCINVELTEKVYIVNFEKDLDMAIVAILLFMCKLSHLSLFHNNSKLNQKVMNSTENSPWIEQMKSLMVYPVPIDAMKVAGECLNKFNLVTKQSLWVLQAFIFSRIYDLYSPEVGDLLADGDSQVFNGVLVQVAFSLGLNRDPDYLPEPMSDEQKHLRRKIWYFLVNLDIMDTIRLGTTISVDASDYDAKLPYYTATEPDGVSGIVEENISKSYIMLRPLLLNLLKLARLVVNVKSKIRLSAVIEAVKDLEAVLARMFGRFRDFLKIDASNCDSFVILSMTHYIRAKLFLVVVYFRLYIYYMNTRNSDLEFFYYKKAYNTLFYELAEVPQAANLESVDTCGTTFALIYTPVLANFLHLSALISASFCIRLESTIRESQMSPFNDERGPKHLHALQELLVLNMECARDLISRTANLGTRYFYCWKNKKGFMYSIKLLRDENLYTVDLNATRSAVLSYSTSHILQFTKTMKFNRAVYEADPDKDLRHDLDLYPLTPESAAKTGRVYNDNDYAEEIQIDNFWCELRNVNLLMDYKREFNGLINPNRKDSKSTQSDNVSIPNDINYFQQFQYEIDNFGANFFDIFQDVNFKLM